MQNWGGCMYDVYQALLPLIFAECVHLFYTGWYLHTFEKSTCTHSSPSIRTFPRVPLQCWSGWWWPFVVLLRLVMSSLPSTPLLPAVSYFCLDTVGVVWTLSGMHSVGSISSLNMCFQFLALGTHWGMIFILDHTGNNIRDKEIMAVSVQSTHLSLSARLYVSL